MTTSRWNNQESRGEKKMKGDFINLNIGYILVTIGISLIILIIMSIFLISLFGGLDYCWTTDLNNPNPIFSLCLFFNLLTPLIPISLFFYGILILNYFLFNKNERRLKTK